jgi:hypothetical protein
MDASSFAALSAVMLVELPSALESALLEMERARMAREDLAMQGMIGRVGFNPDALVENVHGTRACPSWARDARGLVRGHSRLREAGARRGGLWASVIPCLESSSKKGAARSRREFSGTGRGGSREKGLIPCSLLGSAQPRALMASPEGLRLYFGRRMPPEVRDIVFAYGFHLWLAKPLDVVERLELDGFEAFGYTTVAGVPRWALSDRARRVVDF